MDNSEYLAYAPDATAMQSGGELAQLSQLANEQAEAEAEVARLEALLNAANERLKHISEVQVPELMDSLGIEEFKTSTGLKVTVAETIRANIPKANLNAALAWLRAHGHEALIKRSISVDFGRGEDDQASNLLQMLNEQKLVADDKQGVHHSTLTAWVAEKLRKGDELPSELFGVFRQRKSAIEAAAKGSKRK